MEDKPGGRDAKLSIDRHYQPDVERQLTALLTVLKAPPYEESQEKEDSQGERATNLNEKAEDDDQ